MMKNKEMVYIGVHITKEVHKELKVLSSRKETSVSGLIRLALKDFIQKESV